MPVEASTASTVRPPKRHGTPPLPRDVSAKLPSQWNGQCVSIGDEATLKVTLYGKAQVIRLFGIDWPARNQAYGQRARQFAGDLVLGKNVTIYNKGRDGSGRVLGWVFSGKVCLNTQLVSSGLAWWQRQYFPREVKLAQLEAQARSAGRGLWADKAPVPRWEWRRGVRTVAAQTTASTTEPRDAPPIRDAPATPVVNGRFVPPPDIIEKLVPGPDLIISKVIFKPERPRVGEAVQPIIYYRNIGDQPAKGFYIYSAPDEFNNNAGSYGGGELELGPGEEKEYLWGGIRPQHPGNFVLRFSADPYNKVAEHSEVNNDIIVSLKVDP
jgi:endonuclease YncB( thermonuclease family)